MKRIRNKMISKVLGVLGVCGACFMIEACYGTPQADYSDAPMKDVDLTGTIKSADGTIVSDVPVMLTKGRFGDTLRTISDDHGIYTFYDVKGSKEPYHLIIKTPDGSKESVDFKLDRKELLSDKKQIDFVIKSKPS
jgi:hypothetical protein